jgi:hypothetical protein
VRTRDCETLRLAQPLYAQLYAQAIALGVVTPGRVGELAKAGPLVAPGVPLGSASSSVSVDRLADLRLLAGLATLAALGWGLAAPLGVSSRLPLGVLFGTAGPRSGSRVDASVGSADPCLKAPVAGRPSEWVGRSRSLAPALDRRRGAEGNRSSARWGSRELAESEKPMPGRANPATRCEAPCARS